MLSVTLFLAAINGILGELVNGVDRSLFADNLAIYITTRNQRMTTIALQGVNNKLDTWIVERGFSFSPNKTVSMIFRKRNKNQWKSY